MTAPPRPLPGPERLTWDQSAGRACVSCAQQLTTGAVRVGTIRGTSRTPSSGRSGRAGSSSPRSHGTSGPGPWSSSTSGTTAVLSPAGAQVWVSRDDGAAAVAATQEDVWQYGPGFLWEEIEQTWLEYAALGHPDPAQFGLTVTDRGQQVWLRAPHAVIEPTRPGRRA